MRRVKPLPRPVDRCSVFLSDVVEIRDNRCQRHGLEKSPATSPLPFHEICFPRTGFWVRHLGRRELPVDANHLHLLNRGEVHRVSHPLGCGDRNTGILLDDALLAQIQRELLPRGRNDEPFPITHFPIDGPTYRMHCELLQLAQTGAEDLAVEERAIELARRVMRIAYEQPLDPPVGQPTRAHRELCEAARRLAAIDLEQSLSLAWCAERLGVSRFHLSRVFRACTGVGLADYRLKLRLRRAAQELAETGRSLDLIAAGLGFADRSHLSRAFGREFGITPRSYRGRTSGARAT